MQSVQKFLSSLFLGFLLLFHSKSLSKQFYDYPELLKKSKWDLGCSDWELKSPLVAGISVHTEKKSGAYRIYSTARLESPKGVSPARSLEVAQKILAEGLFYPEWIMPGINEDPFGNSYFVKLDSAKAINYKADNQFAIEGKYSLEFLWAKFEGQTSIIFKSIMGELPKCDNLFDQYKNPQMLVYRMIPRPGVLDYMITEAFVSKKNEDIEIKLRAVLKPDQKLYELIPEKVLRHQVEQRARRIFENYSSRHKDFLLNDSLLKSKRPGSLGK